MYWINLKRIVFLSSSFNFFKCLSKKLETISSGLCFLSYPSLQKSEKIGRSFPVSLMDSKGRVKKTLL